MSSCLNCNRLLSSQNIDLKDAPQHFVFGKNALYTPESIIGDKEMLTKYPSPFSCVIDMRRYSMDCRHTHFQLINQTIFAQQLSYSISKCNIFQIYMDFGDSELQ